MTNVKAAEYGALFFDRGRLVWDDYLNHVQHALTPEAERVLRHFAGWRALDSARELGGQAPVVAGRLVDAGALIREGSPEHDTERRMLAEWRGFGPAARYHHFAARTDTGSPFVALEVDEQRFRDKARQQPPPPPAKTYPDRPLITLPGADGGPDDGPDDARWPHGRLLDALYARRSTRHFAARPVGLDDLAGLLRLTAGPVRTVDHPELGPILFRTSPSAGARTPLELYVYANNVAGLPPGLYHYAPTRGGLEDLGRTASTDELQQIMGAQPWLAAAPVVVAHTAVLARTRWRYESRRAYRDIMLEAGHLSQTLLLTAAAAGLGAVFATAVRDELLERLLGSDHLAEITIGVTAIGHP